MSVSEILPSYLQLRQTGDENRGRPGRYSPAWCENPNHIGPSLIGWETRRAGASRGGYQPAKGGYLCCSAHKKNKNWGKTPKYRSETTSTTVTFVHDVPQFCHNFGVTANHKADQPAMGS